MPRGNAKVGWLVYISQCSAELEETEAEVILS
jgi:hypothetical protein